ncbi:unnamed protein product [Rotaria sp. Silwood1]|nr:unnamed protein product [Rotaria sp. Silwood1]
MKEPLTEDSNAVSTFANTVVRQTKTVLCKCKICGASARYSYYGAIVCHSCKMFFKRNAENQKSTLQCSSGNKCVITMNNRHICASCRLRKCLINGMRIEMIRSSRCKKNKRNEKRKLIINSIPLTSTTSVTPDKKYPFDQKGLDLQGESLLHFYATNWKNYRFSSKVTNGFCHYLNRHWVRPMYDSGRRDVYEVFTVIELGFMENSSVPNNRHQITSPTLEIYKDYFEVPFLDHTKQFYRQEAANFLVHNSISEYLKKAPRWIDEELHRAVSYLHSSTLAPLIKILEQALVHEQLEAICTEAKILLHDDNYSDFACLFKLVDRVPNATVQLKKIFENNFRPKGIESMERISATAINDPKDYVETILKIHKDLSNVAQKFFHNNEHLIASLNKACENFINNNAVTEAANNATKSAELLARYCDILLRKGSKVEREIDIEEKFNQIMIVYNYVKDKHSFETFYRKMLVKRLLGKLSASNDNEQSMILRLKNTCDFAYASKLEKMLQDVNLSETLLDQYQTYCEKNKLDDIGI